LSLAKRLKSDPYFPPVGCWLPHSMEIELSHIEKGVSHVGSILNIEFIKRLLNSIPPGLLTVTFGKTLPSPEHSAGTHRRSRLRHNYEK